ncbi:hypothetical protein ABPG72_018704 [Tetrahymena utriculariae]
MIKQKKQAKHKSDQTQSIHIEGSMKFISFTIIFEKSCILQQSIYLIIKFKHKAKLIIEIYLSSFPPLPYFLLILNIKSSYINENSLNHLYIQIILNNEGKQEKQYSTNQLTKNLFIQQTNKLSIN